MKISGLEYKQIFPTQTPTQTRRIFYVDVGSMPIWKASHYLRAARARSAMIRGQSS